MKITPLFFLVVSRILCKWNYTGATCLQNGWLIDLEEIMNIIDGGLAGIVLHFDILVKPTIVVMSANPPDAARCLCEEPRQR